MHGQLTLCLVVFGFVLIVHLIYILLLQILELIWTHIINAFRHDLNEFHKQCGHESTRLLEYQIHIYLLIFAVKQHRMR